MKAQGAEFSESVTTLYELMKESGVVKEQEKHYFCNFVGKK